MTNKHNLHAKQFGRVNIQRNASWQRIPEMLDWNIINLEKWAWALRTDRYKTKENKEQYGSKPDLEVFSSSFSSEASCHFLMARGLEYNWPWIGKQASIPKNVLVRSTIHQWKQKYKLLLSETTLGQINLLLSPRWWQLQTTHLEVILRAKGAQQFSIWETHF